MQRSKITKILAAAVLALAVGPLGLAAANANAATIPDNFTQGTNDGTPVVSGNVQLNSPLDETFDGTRCPARLDSDTMAPPTAGRPSAAATRRRRRGPQRRAGRSGHRARFPCHVRRPGLPARRLR